MSPARLERWTRLIHLLLRHAAVTRDGILEQLPVYFLAAQRAVGDDVVPETIAYESARRKFERDKVGLRALGLCLDTVSLKSVLGRQTRYAYCLKPPVDHPIRLLIGPGPHPVGSATERALSWDDVKTAERALEALPDRVPVLTRTARSVGARLTRTPATDDPAAGMELDLMPEEMLALQVALVLESGGTEVAERLAGE